MERRIVGYPPDIGVSVSAREAQQMLQMPVAVCGGRRCQFYLGHMALVNGNDALQNRFLPLPDICRPSLQPLVIDGLRFRDLDVTTLQNFAGLLIAGENRFAQIEHDVGSEDGFEGVPVFLIHAAEVAGLELLDLLDGDQAFDVG